MLHVGLYKCFVLTYACALVHECFSGLCVVFCGAGMWPGPICLNVAGSCMYVLVFCCPVLAVVWYIWNCGAAVLRDFNESRISATYIDVR